MTKQTGLFFSLLFVSLLGWSGEPSEFIFPQGKVTLLVGNSSIVLHTTTIPEWHTYWKNSGDSGAAPLLQLENANFQILKRLWSFPKRISVEGITNYGYENESLILLETDLKNSQRPEGSLNLEILVCKVECIPYITTLKVPQNNQQALIDQLLEKHPLPLESSNSFQLDLIQETSTDKQFRLRSQNTRFLDFDEIQIFPLDGNIFTTSQPEISLDDRDLVFSIKTTGLKNSQEISDSFLFGFFKDQRLVTSVELSSFTKAKEVPSYIFILLFAFIGGIILNLMPCVFPVLSLKALSLMKQKESTQKSHLEGWAYTAGVCLSFLSLGITLIGLRLAGEEVGWGFQMQNPWTVAGLAVLFFWITMNLFGFFEIDFALQVNSKNKSQFQNSFWSGVLATLVATPCTAPFMGTALGASLTLSPMLSLGVFFAIGFGMALPFLLIGYYPKSISFLPRPGAWMETFKNFLAFPMLLTILWLLWVLSLQAGSPAVLSVLGIFIFIAAVIWTKRLISKEKVGKAILVIGFCFSLISLYWLPRSSPSETQASMIWKSFDPQQIEKDLSENRSVFIDFTAAWCLTCQVNKKTVLRTSEIEDYFQRNQISLYVADWTDKNPIITQELAKYGRNSLPLYVFLENQQKDPILLPELLTKEMILKLKQSTEEK